jgi:Ala-tRNA(Pro) deacylase
MSDAPTPQCLDDGAPPATPEELLARLGELGIASTPVSHPPVFTVEEAKELRGSLPGAHTKNLFVRDKRGVMWLVVALEDRTVDLAAVARALGHTRFSFGSPDRLMRYLGLRPGSVTPFGVLNDRGGHVRVALDTGLRAYDVWNFHPLVNSMTTSIDAADMLRFLGAVDHAPTWVGLAARA